MKDVIIVGGGVIGMLTARFLLEAGLDVMLIDQSELGSEATWAGGGIISPLYPWRYSDAITRLARYSQEHYPALCEQLTKETGISPQWIRSGLLFTPDNEAQMAQQWAEQWSYELHHLSSAYAMHECEPQLAQTLDSGLFFPQLGQVRNPRLAQALRTSLRLSPITLAEHYPVTGLEIEQDKVKGVRLGTEVFRAGKVVIAAGAWTSLFPELQAANIQIQPVLGQMILFRGPRKLLQRMVLHNGRYLIPRADGRILCGSTLELCGFDKHTTEQAKQELREAAFSMMPALRDLPLLNHWSGLRPASPDGTPYIGEHPTIKGLYVNAGHYRNGVVLGLASARLLVAMLLGKELMLDPAPYRVEAIRLPAAELAV